MLAVSFGEPPILPGNRPATSPARRTPRPPGDTGAHERRGPTLGGKCLEIPGRRAGPPVALAGGGTRREPPRSADGPPAWGEGSALMSLDVVMCFGVQARPYRAAVARAVRSVPGLAGGLLEGCDV